MKQILPLLFLLGALTINAQNQEIRTEDNPPFLLGPITVDRLIKEPYDSWYAAGYETYQVDKSLVELFQKKLEKYTLKLFLGTWCGDSKREVPRIIKILEAAKFPLENLTLIALDRRPGTYKKSPSGEEKAWNIQKVPTLIFLKNGKEINRIVESPLDSLEEDMLAILHGKSYVPNYSMKWKDNMQKINTQKLNFAL